MSKRFILIPAPVHPALLTEEDRPHWVEVDGSLESMQKLVGGYVAHVTLTRERDGSGIDFWCHDEGLLLKLPLNPIATTLARQTIVGPVFLSRYDAEGETLSAQPGDLAWIYQQLDIEPPEGT